MKLLDENRLFPVDPVGCGLAASLYDEVRSLPIISPHGHTDPRWFAANEAFTDPAQLLIVPDHYIVRMLVSQGITLQQLGVSGSGNQEAERDGRTIWRLFAQNYFLFAATPTRLWLDHAFQTLFDLDKKLSGETADLYYDRISDYLQRDDFRPRALYDRFGIEVLATTESALDDLNWHRAIQDSGWNGRVVTTYRPDSVIDPSFAGFDENIERFGELTNCDTSSFKNYLEAHRVRRAFFRQHGATATDHGHPTARTADLSPGEADALYQTVRGGKSTPDKQELFRAQMLTEMARLSLEDGMVMQLHCGSWRNHSASIASGFGRDMGFDIPQPTDYVGGLKPLLDSVGLEPDLTIILFTLDETVYGRELAPLAGVYPCLKLGPPWWFYDAPEGMRRFREQVTETAGFYNTVGFNDDTRAFCSIPGRHDMARRTDCAYLANCVVTGRLREDEAFPIAHDLAYRLAKETYRF